MISEKLKKIILQELSLPDFALEDSTLALEVPRWDSLNHIKILTAIEKEYDLHFKSLEVMRLKNVGDLQALIDKKIQLKKMV